MTYDDQTPVTDLTVGDLKTIIDERVSESPLPTAADGIGTTQDQFGGVRIAGIPEFRFIIPPAGDSRQVRWNSARYHVFRAHLGGFGGKPMFVPYFHFDEDTIHPHGGLPTVSEHIESHAVLVSPPGAPPVSTAETVALAVQWAAEERVNQEKRRAML